MSAGYRETAAWLKDRLPAQPVAGLILGTGLNDLADSLEQLARFPYSEIPGFAQSTAPSHKGVLVLAVLGGKPVLVLQGRFHFYEGHSMDAVVFPTGCWLAWG
jgi:purine-nucleoside phosphorylase